MLPVPPPTDTNVAARLSGLRAEAGTWRQQSDQFFAMAKTLSGATFGDGAQGPFAQFITLYEQQRTRVVKLSADGGQAMRQVSDTLVAIANRYASLDDDLAAGYRRLTGTA